MTYSLFISTAKGMEYLLQDELQSLGLAVSRVSPRGVYGSGDLALIYTLCLWSRLASRVYVILIEADITNQAMLYEHCKAYPWQSVFDVQRSIAIDFTGNSADIRNTMYGAQVVKDGIVDHFQRQQQRRPTVNRAEPDIRLHAYLHKERITISLDMTGYGMHQRGYRLESGLAPLRETVAAAILLRGKWPELSQLGFSLCDPFCGAGTLVIEAAMMAARMAPGLLRHDQALQNWQQHQPVLWQQLRQQAQEQVCMPAQIYHGSDHSASVLRMAQANAERAHVAGFTQFVVQDVTACQAPAAQGLLICNPPYGERLGDASELIPVYGALGDIVRSEFADWQVAVLTEHASLARATGLRARKQYSIYNGALACQLYCMTPVRTGQQPHCSVSMDPVHVPKDVPWVAQPAGRSPQAQMLANRLTKNHTHLQKWAKRNHVEAYRLYDRDLPEYAFAIDLYADYAIVQEYQAPVTVPLQVAQIRALEVMQVVPQVLNIHPDHIISKRREKQKGTAQYQKLAAQGRTQIIQEGPARLIINLYDYLDTGLFLDHRPLRLSFQQIRPGLRFLNCFCYTATASVHAALAGAATTNVDLSRTYLQWAQENFKLNQLDISQHQFIQDDCTQWLQQTRDQFDVIFLDPPSFSNSKRMQTTLDIQRDHPHLIKQAMRLLSQQGILYFSTNFKQFQLSATILSAYDVEDITMKTIAEDFKRTPQIHRCFTIKVKT